MDDENTRNFANFEVRVPHYPLFLLLRDNEPTPLRSPACTYGLPTSGFASLPVIATTYVLYNLLREPTLLLKIIYILVPQPPTMRIATLLLMYRQPQTLQQSFACGRLHSGEFIQVRLYEC